MPLPAIATIKHLFIDLDDTLWATYENNKQSLKALYERLDWNRYFTSFEALFRVYMPHNERLWALYREEKISKQELIIQRFKYPLHSYLSYTNNQYWELNNIFLEETARQTRLVEGAIALLEYLSPYYSIYILSNGFREVQNAKITRSGLDPFFRKIILSEDAGYPKPHKGIFRYALSLTGASCYNSMMIGDSWEADIEGSVGMGIPAIWFNPHKIERPVEKLSQESGCSIWEVSSLDEIHSIL